MKIVAIYLKDGKWFMDVDALDSGNGIRGLKISESVAKMLIDDFGLTEDEFGEYY